MRFRPLIAGLIFVALIGQATAQLMMTGAGPANPIAGPTVLALVPQTSAVIQRANTQTMVATTASFTPPDNSLLVIAAGFENGNGATAGTLAITDSLGVHLSYASRISSTTQYLGGSPPSYYGRVNVWTAQVTTGAPMTITVSSSENVAGDIGSILVSVSAVTGSVDFADPVGVTVVDETPGDGPLTIELDNFPSALSLILAGRIREDNGSVSTGATPGAGWTGIHDLHSVSSGYLDAQTMYRPPGTTSRDVSWAATSSNPAATSWLRHSFGMEIKRAGAPPSVFGFADDDGFTSATPGDHWIDDNGQTTWVDDQGVHG